MWFLFVQLTRSTQLLYSVSSLDEYSKSVVTNKLLYKWTKTEFHVFVDFFHGEVTIGFHHHLRRRDTAINISEHVVVQPNVCCVTIQRSIWYCYVTICVYYYTFLKVSIYIHNYLSICNASASYRKLIQTQYKTNPFVWW